MGFNWKKENNDLLLHNIKSNTLPSRDVFLDGFVSKGAFRLAFGAIGAGRELRIALQGFITNVSSIALENAHQEAQTPSNEP
jgi:hypothetical protein